MRREPGGLWVIGCGGALKGAGHGKGLPVLLITVAVGDNGEVRWRQPVLGVVAVRCKAWVSVEPGVAGVVGGVVAVGAVRPDCPVGVGQSVVPQVVPEV